MQLGAVLPQNELGDDTEAILAFARHADELGFAHLLAYDHVLGANRSVHADLVGPYGLDDPFREPFVLFAYLAATTRLEFATAILIAPQRPTALIAKQAAELDLLSDGRFRLGVGNGWNPVEYEALGQDFSSRGARLEVQIGIMRALWMNEQVDAATGTERIVAAGLRPRPTRSIPIWIGAIAPAALARVGRVADGWFPMSLPGHGFEENLVQVRRSAEDAGRDPLALGIEGQVPCDPDSIERRVERWEASGATHVAVNTLNQGLVGLDAHLAALEGAAAALGIPARER